MNSRLTSGLAGEDVHHEYPASFDALRFDAEMRAFDFRFSRLLLRARAAREAAQATRDAVERRELAYAGNRPEGNEDRKAQPSPPSGRSLRRSIFRRSRAAQLSACNRQ